MTILDQCQKFAYFAGNSDWHDEFYPFNQFSAPSVVVDRDRDLDRLENHQRNGEDFEEFKRFMRKKMLRRMRQKRKKYLSPTPFWDASVYGYTGFEGARSYPLSYYSGWIGDDPGAMQNPWANYTYQSSATASDEQIGLLKLASLFDRLTGA